MGSPGITHSVSRATSCLRERRRRCSCRSRIPNSAVNPGLQQRCVAPAIDLRWRAMRAVLVTLLHLAVTAAKLCGPGGVRAVVAENLLLKQQLTVLRRRRQRAPNLTASDRLVCGIGSLFLSPGRIRKVAIGVRPSTLLTFHQALVRRKYRQLFPSSRRPQKPGPKGPSEAFIRAIVELKSRNPRFGRPRIARIVSTTFGLDVDRNVVYRVLSKHYRPSPGGAGPSWRSFIGHMADSLWSVATFPYEPILLHSYWVRVVLYHCTRGREGLCWDARDRECELAVQKSSPSCIDQPFYEGMRRWHMPYGVDVIDLEPPRIRGPAFIAASHCGWLRPGPSGCPARSCAWCRQAC